MKHKPYPAYKDSGIKWLGKTPEHWSIKRLRFVARLNPSKSESVGLPRDTEVSFLPMEAIGDDGSLNLDRVREIGEVESGYSYFCEGDVSIAKITPCFENGKGAVMRGLENGLGFGTTELIVVRPLETETVSEYLQWLFVSYPFRKMGESHMYGAGGQKRVPDDFVRNFTIAFPSLQEQLAIASFLDRETAKIDTLIEKQERLIELLQEKRQATISHAVTKGLNPAASMKDSGVEWLGEVPTHWEVKRLKFLCRVQTGSKDTVDAVDEGLYPFFVRSQIVERINSFSADCEAVLTAGDGAGVGKVFHYYTGKFDFHQRVYMLSNFKGILGKIIYYYFRELFHKVALEGGAKSTVDSLRMPVFLNFPVCVPAEDEQARILNFIENEETRINTLIQKSEHSIDLMRERRSALISAAVTGKIDVRDEAIREAA